MELVIPGFVGFVIWFLVMMARSRAREKREALLPPVPPKSVDLATIAKQHNRRMRLEQERLEDEELMRKHNDRKAGKNTDTTPPPPWFIGDWGINEPSHAEQLIINELIRYNFKWYREVSFKDLILPSGGFPRVDFYFPKYKIAIEYQGIGYHSSPDRVFSDKLKASYCKNKGIKLLIYEVEQYRKMETTICSLMRSLHIDLKNAR